MEVELISLKGLEYRLDRGMAMQLIDLRPFEDYQAAHIQGAVNIPYNQLAERMGELLGTAAYLLLCKGECQPSGCQDGSGEWVFCILGYVRNRLLQRPAHDSELTSPGLGYKIKTRDNVEENAHENTVCF